MRYRRLGRCGFAVSEIGFGTWGLGGTHDGAVAYGPTDDHESIAALRRAWELGVTFFDTADLYGHGHSETLLGCALAEVRHKAIIATKAGFLHDGSSQDFSPAHLENALRRSLDRLGTSYVDLFLLHSPPLDWLRADRAIWRCLQAMKRWRQVRAIGVSVRSPDDGLAVAEEFEPDALEVNFNLTDQRAAQNGLLDCCVRRNIGVIIRTPLCFGFLTGAFRETAFDATDHRSRWSPEQRARWHEAQQVCGDCIQTREDQSPAQLALRFCLSYAGVGTVIPGMLTRAHVEANVPASDQGPLCPEDLHRIEQVFRAQTFFLGKHASGHHRPSTRRTAQ